MFLFVFFIYSVAILVKPQFCNSRSMRSALGVAYTVWVGPDAPTSRSRSPGRKRNGISIKTGSVNLVEASEVSRLSRSSSRIAHLDGFGFSNAAPSRHSTCVCCRNAACPACEARSRCHAILGCLQCRLYRRNAHALSPSLVYASATLLTGPGGRWPHLQP